MELHISEESQFNSLLPITDLTLDTSSYARYVDTATVEILTLDQIAATCPQTLGLKIDVQGFEREVLDGGSETLDAGHGTSTSNSAPRSCTRVRWRCWN